ncbi:MAG: hypothetical protein IKI65_00510, partial [Firmicutes bacterium]|nr:hypothetical protein [Bacillota bacterium]
MSNVRKLLAVLLAAVLVLGLAACGGKQTSEPAPAPAQEPAKAEEPAKTEEPAQEEPAAEPVEVIVFAAASMTETLTKIADLYKSVAPEVKLTYNFDSSG